MKTLFFIICSLFFAFNVYNVYAEDDIVKFIEKQRIGLTLKQEAINEKEVRLNILKKEINEDIDKYTRLLQQIDTLLKKAEVTENKRLRHVAKAYEAMPPEDAASRLSGLDNTTTVKILLKMNSKKAGLVIGMMEPQKATSITKEMAELKR